MTTDKPIHFTGQVIKVETMSDGGIRLTLDMGEKDIEAAAAMMQAKRMNMLVELAALFVNVTPIQVQVKEDNVRPKTRYSPYAKSEETKGKKGKDKEAFDEAFKSIGLGQKIQDSQGNLIYYLIGLAIKTTGLETLQKILETSKADNQTLDQYLERLGKYEDNKTGLSTALKVEYLIQKNAADSVVEGSSRPSEVFNTEDFGFVPNEGRLANNNFYFKPNKTKKLFAGYIRGILNDISKPCGFVKEKEPKRLTPLDKFKLIFTENAIGKILNDVVSVSLGSIHNRRCDGDLAVSGTKLLIAIKMYKNDKNSYPATINDLMPLYLTEIPKDPYNGESMRYSSGKKLIYSVGKDLQDSGGTKSKEWSKAADPSFEIGF